MARQNSIAKPLHPYAMNLHPALEFSFAAYFTFEDTGGKVGSFGDREEDIHFETFHFCVLDRDKRVITAEGFRNTLQIRLLQGYHSVLVWAASDLGGRRSG